ncbi:unnamed protein product [Cuscuta campestris]|uniref:Uncharacterized protein n=1 Tax=Cuscuta campestris TaxID=132261 RepID=A0A484L380_9ASTE|nr:unnamed protein product [Cuscuta campestris]
MSRFLSISRSTALWLSETLSHQPLAREGWVISKFEGPVSAKSHWDSNHFGSFVRISGGTDGDIANICIPVGRQLEGIRLFVKALNAALKILEGYESAEKVPMREEASISQDLIDQIFRVERIEDEQLRFPSISSNLLEQDVLQGSRMPSLTEQGKNADSQETKEDGDEEKKLQKLFQPAFEAYFETIFRAVESQIQEALAKTSLLDQLKMGLFQNMSGKTLRATRETVKSMEKVTLVQFEDSKYPAFISCSKADERLVADFLTGDQAEESQTSIG